MILSNKSDWVREVLVIGTPDYIVELETNYLTAMDVRNNPMSYNMHNGDLRPSPGELNPMKNPIIAKRMADKHRGDKHWTHNLQGKDHPQKGQIRNSIRGDNHPNKNPKNAEKISVALTGIKRPYQEGDNNPMRRPEIAAKFKGINHWVNNLENRKSCEYCGIVDISKSNYTRWHGENCKLKKEYHG
jgi:hypothetical protein